MKKMAMQMILGLAIIGIIAFFIIAGYNTEQRVINKITTSYAIYIEASFEEEDCGINWDGDYECETTYWSETVSDKWYIETIVDTSGTHIVHSHGEVTGFKTKMPPLAVDRSDSYYFRRNTTREEQSYKVWYDKSELTEDYVSVSYSNMLKLIEQIDTQVTIKTWWGISYNVKL